MTASMWHWGAVAGSLRTALPSTWRGSRHRVDVLDQTPSCCCQPQPGSTFAPTLQPVRQSCAATSPPPPLTSLCLCPSMGNQPGPARVRDHTTRPSCPFSMVNRQLPHSAADDGSSSRATSRAWARGCRLVPYLARGAFGWTRRSAYLGTWSDTLGSVGKRRPPTRATNPVAGCSATGTPEAILRRNRLEKTVPSIDERELLVVLAAWASTSLAGTPRAGCLASWFLRRPNNASSSSSPEQESTDDRPASTLECLIGPPHAQG